MSLRSTTIRSQAGFTLVELAIVMIIIGLLIGGVLKGQQLITNAQVAAEVAQIKAIDAATTSFKDMYASLPGDLLTPTTRLSGCAAALCITPGDGNGRITEVPGAAGNTENRTFFIHLAAANLLTGINANAIVGNCTAWGQCYPAGKISATGLMIGYTPGAVALASQSGAVAANNHGGHYLSLDNDPDVAMSVNGTMTPNVAKRIDDKIDDGVTNSGVVLAAGAAAGANGCQSAVAGAYNEAVEAKYCNLYIQIQN